MNEFVKNKIKWFIKMVIKIYNVYVKDYNDPTLEVRGMFLDILKSFEKFGMRD